MTLRLGATSYEVDRDCAVKDDTGRTWIFTTGEALPDWVTAEQAEAMVQAGMVTEFGVI